MSAPADQISSLGLQENAPPFASPFPPDVAFAWGEAGRTATPLPEERALLGPNVSERRLREFALGRACAREAVAALDPRHAQRPILRAAGRAPRWPAGIVGAITHTGGSAAAAAAQEALYLGVGLDLEARPRGSERLARRILRPAERERLAGLPPEQFAGRVAVIFSAKESIYKALNPATGIYLGFQDAEIEGLPGPEAGSGELRWRLLRACGPALPAGYEGRGRFAAHGGLVLTGVWVPRGAGA